MSRDINDPAMGVRALINEADLTDDELSMLIERLRASRLADIANTKAKVARERVSKATGEKRAAPRKVKTDVLQKLAETAGVSLTPEKMAKLRRYLEEKSNG